jgi:hypothetical protein
MRSQTWRRVLLAVLILAVPVLAHSASLDTTLSLTIQSNMIGTATSFSTPTANAARAYTLALTSGTGADQADKVFYAQRTITASANDDLDLAGVLTDPLGATLTFVKVKAILIVAAAGNTNNVVVGNAAGTQFVGPFGAAAHTIAIAPGDMFLITKRGSAGWSVGAGSTDLLRIANSAGGTSVVYDIFIVGTSA